MAGETSLNVTKGSAVSLNIYGPNSSTIPTVSGIHIVTALNYSTDHWTCVFDDGYGDSGTNIITISASGFNTANSTYIKGGNNSTINITLQSSTSSLSTSTNVGSKLYGWYRSNPSSGISKFLYTDSPDIFVSMTLYDNNGNDTSLRITSVNQDGSFNINSYTNVYCYRDSSLNHYYVFNVAMGDSVYNESGTLIGTITAINDNTITINMSTTFKNAGLVTDQVIATYMNAGSVTDSNITNTMDAGAL